MATRAVVYFHHNDEKANWLNYTMKLYHHRDWYLDWLWINLNDIFSSWKKEYEDPKNVSWSQRGLLQKIAEEWWFEMTCRYHMDTEYIYHVYFGEGRWLDNKFDFKIYYQNDDDHEWVRNENMILFSDNWKIDKQFIS